MTASSGQAARSEASGEAGRVRTKADLVYERLKRWILSGRLEAGQLLTQQALADIVGYDVSRMPLREALSRLQSEGLVHSQPHRTARVAELSMVEMRDIYAARESLESMLAAHGAPKVGPRELERMEEQLKAQKAALVDQDFEAFVRFDRAFHSTLYEASGFRHSQRLVHQLRDISDRYVRAYASTNHLAEEGLSQHQALLEASRNKDVEGARGITALHIQAGVTGLAGQRHRSEPERFARRSDERSASMLTVPRPARINRLYLPERDLPGGSLRQAEHILRASAPAGDKRLVDLTYADTRRFPPPDWVIEEFTRAATRGGMTYTPYRGDAAVREHVARNVGAFLDVPLDPERHVVLTPGSQAALYHAFASIVEEGDTVAIGDPDYLTTERMLRYFGAEVIRVPVRWDSRVPGLDLDVLEDVLATRPRLLVFSNPNNPTGAVAGPESIARVAELLHQHGDTLVLVDELYCRLVYDGRPFTHLIAQEGMQNRCITVLGPSKTESMSGYRVGVSIAPPEITDRMDDLLGVTVLRAPAYAQRLLVRWLVDDHDYVAQRTVEYQALRDHTVERLNSSDVLEVLPSGGSAYLFPQIMGIDLPEQQVLARLQSEASVVINPGYQFGLRGAGHLRICFAQDDRIWDEVLDRVLASLGGMQGRG